MATSRETAERDSVKNAETAVMNVVREEDNDVTLTADQHVVMGNEKNFVDPLRNLDDHAMCLEKVERSCICYKKVHLRLRWTIFPKIRMVCISPKCIANES